jgi:hypothetical protein
METQLSGRRCASRLILQQAVVKPDPVYLFRYPDVLGRRKGVAVIEGGQCYANRRAGGTPGELPAATDRAAAPVDAATDRKPDLPTIPIRRKR